jgi:hypothetical protein
VLKRRHGPLTAQFLSENFPNYRPGALLSEPGSCAPWKFPTKTSIHAFRTSIFTGFACASARDAATRLAFFK